MQIDIHIETKKDREGNIQKVVFKTYNMANRKKPY